MLGRKIELKKNGVLIEDAESDGSCSINALVIALFRNTVLIDFLCGIPDIHFKPTNHNKTEIVEKVLGLTLDDTSYIDSKYDENKKTLQKLLTPIFRDYILTLAASDSIYRDGVFIAFQPLIQQFNTPHKKREQWGASSLSNQDDMFARQKEILNILGEKYRAGATYEDIEEWFWSKDETGGFNLLIANLKKDGSWLSDQELAVYCRQFGITLLNQTDYKIVTLHNACPKLPGGISLNKNQLQQLQFRQVILNEEDMILTSLNQEVLKRKLSAIDSTFSKELIHGINVGAIRKNDKLSNLSAELKEELANRNVINNEKSCQLICDDIDELAIRFAAIDKADDILTACKTLKEPLSLTFSHRHKHYYHVFYPNAEESEFLHSIDGTARKKKEEDKRLEAEAKKKEAEAKKKEAEARKKPAGAEKKPESFKDLLSAAKVQVEKLTTQLTEQAVAAEKFADSEHKAVLIELTAEERDVAASKVLKTQSKMEEFDENEIKIKKWLEAVEKHSTLVTEILPRARVILDKLTNVSPEKAREEDNENLKNVIEEFGRVNKSITAIKETIKILNVKFEERISIYKEIKDETAKEKLETARQLEEALKMEEVARLNKEMREVKPVEILNKKPKAKSKKGLRKLFGMFKSKKEKHDKKESNEIIHKEKRKGKDF